MKWPRRNSRKRRSALGRRKRIVFRWKIVIAVVFFIAFLIVLGWISRIDNLTIKNIEITGTDVVKKEEVLSIVERELSTSYFYLIPRKNSLVYPKDRIKRVLLAELTRLKEVNVERENLEAIQIDVKERGPFAMWCGNEFIDTTTDLGNCYFIDEDSFIFAPAPDFSGNVFFKYFGEREELREDEAILASSYMELERFAAFKLFIDSFEELPFEPVSLTKRVDGDFEVRLTTGTVISFGIENSLSVVLDTLQSILESERLLQEGEVLEYIDLRFDNRVYYKFVNEEEIETDVEEGE